MTYAVRNTLFIAAFWSVILAGGFFYVYGHQQKVILKARNENRIKGQRLKDLLALERDRSVLQDRLAGLDAFCQGKQGTIAAEESPGETFDYLLRELSRTKSDLSVDFSLKSQDSYLSLERRTYEIKGSGSFHDFYELLTLLEEGPVFYDVHQIEMDANNPDPEKGRRGDVGFSLEFNGYNRMEGPLITSITPSEDLSPQIADLVGGKSYRGPGRLRTSSDQPATAGTAPAKPVVPQNTEGLPEIDGRTKILAIMPGAAVLKDQNGRTVRLKPGDRVFGGTLAEINTKAGTLSFSLENGNGDAKRMVLPSGTN